MIEKFQNFLGYHDDSVIRPLCTKLLQTIGYVKHFDKSYGDKVNTNFQGKKVPKENA